MSGLVRIDELFRLVEHVLLQTFQNRILAPDRRPRQIGGLRLLFTRRELVQKSKDVLLSLFFFLSFAQALLLFFHAIIICTGAAGHMERFLLARIARH